MQSNKSIRLLVALAALALIALPALAERGDDADRKSKNGKATGTIDGVEITVEYGRPNVKDREIWGGLVPYDKVWRTGANEATTITFSTDVKIEGKKLEAGTYGLFTVPGEKKWHFVFNKVADQWGSGKYDEAQDVLRVTAKPKAADHVESMDFAVDGKRVMFSWEKLAVGFKVKASS